MQAQTQLMPGYRLDEYLMVLTPHEDLRNRIMTIKKDFGEKYRSQLALSSKPHLTLAKFVSWNMNEERIINKFQRLAMGVTPFRVELSNFGAFPTHSIYINVSTKISIQELVREMRGAQKLMKAHPEIKPHFMTEPHVTIARKLLPWQYEQAWAEYSRLHFSAKFIADSMLMLKRPLNGRAYQVVSRLEFRNMPVATTQGALF